MLKKTPAFLLFLALLCSLSFSEQTCMIEPEYPLVSPGAQLSINLSYSNFPYSAPIILLCRPNSLRLCFAGPDSGNCNLVCDYPYKGVYTLSASSPLVQCATALVVVDPKAKPACSLKADRTWGNGTLDTTLTARFSNLLPNTTSATYDCGDGKKTTVDLVRNGIVFNCHYSADRKKELPAPQINAGGAICSSRLTVIPSSDSEPPQVSFYNLTYRFAIRDNLSIYINASDNVDIDRVELLLDGQVIGIMRQQPYVYKFNAENYTNGTKFSFRAIAYDIYGNSNSTSVYDLFKAYDGTRSCNLSVNPVYSPIPAGIRLTATFYNTSSDVMFASFKPDWPYDTINFTDPRVPINNGTATTIATYATPGIFNAYATDGNVTCKKKVYITATKDTTPPTVTLTNPVSGQQIKISDVIELRSRSSDNVLVWNVEYYLEDKLIANATDYPFNASWDTSNEHMGYYYVKAVAYDAAGNPSIIPTKALVALYTNRTCSINPKSAFVLPMVPVNLSISCFNFTKTNFTQPVSNVSNEEEEEEETESIVVTDKEFFTTSFDRISCPNMTWTSTFGYSMIHPFMSSSSVTFTPQDTSLETPGLITARDPVTGFSCDSTITIVKSLPGCRVSFDSPAILGNPVQVKTLYENLTKSQEFRITCKPNVVATCRADSGSGSCSAECAYPSTGRYSVTASSPYLTCSSKNIAILPHPDTLPPTIAITRPFNGQILTGIYPVEAYATDNFGVSQVEFYIDGILGGVEYTSPYTYYFNTTAVRNGDHALLARAYDESGNTRDYSITVTIAN